MKILTLHCDYIRFKPLKKAIKDPEKLSEDRLKEITIKDALVILTAVEKGNALISWSGSMFEYLMPSLVMHSPADSILEQTCRLIVKKQISYGKEKNVPWGISESAYNTRDLHLTYQYSNFGVPELGLKRGLGQDLVIAPYATMLACMVDPVEAVKNLKNLPEKRKKRKINLNLF